MILTQYITENRDAFILEVENVSSRLGINPNWLMAVMFKESRLNHRAVNPTSGATGLIQFMPSTAGGLGTTITLLREMSNVEQLYWVHKYLKPYAYKFKSYTDVYLAVFFPAAIGKPQDYVLQTSSLSAGLIANQNKALDTNNNNQLTVAEVEAWALRGFDANTVNELKKKAL